MSFSVPEIQAEGSNEALEMARARLAESGDTAARAVRYHLFEALCRELLAIRLELRALREAVEQR